LHEQQHAVVDDNDNDDIPGNQGRNGATDGGPSTRDVRDARDSREINNNSRITTGTGLPRNPLFDIGSVIYSIPRTVLLNPTTNTVTSNRRRNGGLTISEIEENTEIMTYGSIPSNYILNTECPITRETFTPESVVLTLKQCKHCFVPFRMMTWLETNSTCPLCRSSVVREETSQTNITDSNPDNAHDGDDVGHADDGDATNNSQTTDNINISNIFNTLMQNSNNDFNNLSVDNVNDNSIMFSFDLPRSQVNSQNTNDNSFMIPQIERLLSNTLSRSILNNNTPITNVTPPDSNNNEVNDDNDDTNDNYDNYDNYDNDYQDVD
jgi:predicted Zn-ribbon and HTH transcriptional regulator